MFLFIEFIAAGGIVVLPSGRRIGVTVTSSHSMGTCSKRYSVTRLLNAVGLALTSALFALLSQFKVEG